MIKSQNRLGENFLNTNGTPMKIIRYRIAGDITIEFQDKYKHQVNTTYSNFRRRGISNPYDITIHGVGYIGVGRHITHIGDEHTNSYDTWKNMLERCYNEKLRYKHLSYIDCSVCEEWLCFQTFADWYEENFYSIEGERVHLDKDILIKGNKIYSPETCIFVPQRINMLFMNKLNKWNLPSGISMSQTGKYITSYNGKHLGTIDRLEDAIYAHDTEKRRCIKEIANEYKEILPPKVYDALLKW